MLWGDVQFWIVTALALSGLWLVVKAVWPGAARRARKGGTRASLTVSMAGSGSKPDADAGVPDRR
jgi:hypothetical protein